MKTLEEITKIINWYMDNSDNASPEYLLYTQDKLAGYSWHLAEIVADQKKQYNISYFTRKISVNRRKQELMQEFSGVKAEAQSIVESEQEYKAEIEDEALAAKLDLMLQQCNKVLSAIAQRISYLKIEKQQTK